MDSWGWLEKRGDKFYSYTGTEVPAENVEYYDQGFRGQMYYEKYTKAQISALKILLQYWNLVYGIPLDYEPTMWEINREALDGCPGIWSHTSVRQDKSDIHPQKELIRMLKSLTKKK